MIDAIRAAADVNELPVSKLIADALKRDAVQFDEVSDNEVVYMYDKYVTSMGEE